MIRTLEEIPVLIAMDVGLGGPLLRISKFASITLDDGQEPHKSTVILLRP